MAHKTKQLAEVARDLVAHAAWLSENGAPDLPAIPLPGVAARPKTPTAPQPAAVSPPTIRTPPPAAAAAPALKSEVRSLTQIREELGDCRRCRLCEGRNKIVFGVGNPKAELMFIGEGPGADEDRKGEPFVGRAGQLLDKMIVAMGFSRADVYIANIVKCRPPENRAPEPDEMATCIPFLRAQVAAVGPRVIVVLGKTATQGLLNDKTPITRLRGRWLSYEGVPVMPTFHPAYLLRSPGEKAKAWEDLKAVVKQLGRELPAR
jgi:uracil-DNA glycosylase